MFIEITQHAIDRVILRSAKVNSEKKASFFIIGLFRELYTSEKRKGNKKQIKYLWHRKYVIDSWRHKFIFKKTLNSTLKIITYINKDYEPITKWI